MTTAYCFDLDGTITTTELLPAIAAEVGIAEEMETLTRATMDGFIPFAQSLRLRAMLLGTVDIRKIHDVVSDMPLQQDILQFIHERPTASFVVTGNLDVWVESLEQRIGIEIFASTATFGQGRLTIDRVLDKSEAVREIRSRGFDRIIAVGDGANDRSMFEAADLAVAFGGVHTPARVAVQASDFIVHDGRLLCRLLTGL